METLFWIIAIVVIIGYLANEQNKKIQKLKEEYEKTLRGKDKGIALNAGRAYYRALKGKSGLNRIAFGTSQIMADEVAIMNEINTMM